MSSFHTQFDNPSVFLIKNPFWKVGNTPFKFDNLVEVNLHSIKIQEFDK